MDEERGSRSFVGSCVVSLLPWPAPLFIQDGKMPAGFFPSSSLAAMKAPQASVPRCGACGLYKTCKTPKMEPSGRGKRRILIVGEYPTQSEDEKGKHFTGKGGELLRSTLLSVGVNPDRDCWFTDAIICCPKDGKTSFEDAMDYCQPNLRKTVESLNPEVIIPLGSLAVRSLLSLMWKEQVGSINRWVGWQIPSQRFNTWVCPTWHPSFLLRAKDNLPQLHMSRHLQGAVNLDGRPWPDGLPKYEDFVQLIFDPDEACRIIRSWTKKGGVFSFDYETDRIKPDSKEAAILCASICRNGRKTISFPWVGDVPREFKKWVVSEHPKIGANIKFEERWTRRRLGVSVRNWKWCCQLGAHWYDNRQGTKSVKFQSFVWLGVDAYDEHIKGELSAKGGNARNKAAHEVDLNDLLFYCGLDSIYEYHIALRQMSFCKGIRLR